MVFDNTNIAENAASDNKIGFLVRKALVQASLESRLILGLSKIVKCLMEGSTEVPTFCLISPPKTGDYATHMLEVLLNAYCLENGIYTIHLDSAEKLCRIVNSNTLESCALIFANPSGDSDCEGSFLDEDYQLTKIEKQIANYYEDNCDDSEHSTIRLPEK